MTIEPSGNWNVSEGVCLYAHSWMGRGMCATARGLHANNNSNDDPFDSMHPGLVQFCFADGSVRGLKKGVAYWDATAPFPPQIPQWETPWAFHELAGFRDGGVRDTSALMP
jgi:prepilin-type processing-associated H-X9-DG protein